jgi:hypothetical protein
MAYATERIKTVAECDKCLTGAQKLKSKLANKKTTFEFQVENRSEKALDISSEFISVNAELTALLAYINTLPEGPKKKEKIVEQQELEWKLAMLDKNSDAYGIYSYLNKQFELACLENDLEEVDLYIAALEARKVELT